MTTSRLPFLIAAALIAAALGDALVETIANTGALGHGYADNDHISVIPTLVGGATIAALIVWSRCVALLRHAKEISSHSLFEDLPVVLALQFGALFVMESCEQLWYGGRLFGGTSWLGGPLWFSALVHLLLGSSCTLLLRRAVRAIAARCALLVGIALEFILDAFALTTASVFAHRSDRSWFPSNQTLRVHQIGERAPPLLLA